MPDIWPRRNLGLADYWGRSVEARINGIDEALLGAKGSASGLERYSVASLSDMSKMASRLTAAGKALDVRRAEIAALAEQVSKAVLASPNYFAVSTRATGFSLAKGWKTVATIPIPRPAGKTRLDVAVQGVTQVTPPPNNGGSSVGREGYRWPFSPSLTSPTGGEFGDRSEWNLPYHNGQDFTVPIGTPIYAAFDGKVITKGYYSDYGNYIRIQHPSIDGHSVWTGYAHMNVPSPLAVGAQVYRGQQIGTSGNTGFVTGPHLHWETSVDGVRINPRTFMAGLGADVEADPGGEWNQVPRARFLINGTASVEYRAVPGSNQITHWSVSGASLPAAPATTSVQLQVWSPAATAATSLNAATVTATGGFI